MGRIADAIREGVSMPEQKRRQILILDEELSTLEAENKILKAENFRLQAEVNPLKKENEQLKARIKRQDEASLDEISEAILVTVANNEASKRKPPIRETVVTAADLDDLISRIVEVATHLRKLLAHFKAYP